MEDREAFFNLIWAIVFLVIFFRYAIYLPMKRKMLEEKSKEAIIKTAEHLEKMANNEKNLHNSKLLARIEALEKALQEQRK